MAAITTFLRTARDQATDLRRRFVAHLMLHRRAQTRVALAAALVISLTMMMLSPGGDDGRAGDELSACSAPTTIVASVPVDWRVVALPRDVIAPHLSPGDRVDVVSRAQVIAGDAVVVNPPTETDGVVVAVPPDAAALVATSAREGDVSVVGHG